MRATRALLAAAVVCLLTVASGCTESDEPVVRAAAQTIEAFKGQGIALRLFRPGTRDVLCPPNPPDGSKKYQSCWESDFQIGEDEGRPRRTALLVPDLDRPNPPNLSVSIYRTAADVEAAEADDGFPSTDPILGVPLDTVSRDNVVVTCGDCSDELLDRISQALDDQ